MTECRPIVAAEADQFLELLCQAFGIELERVRGVFFQEPLFDLNRKWALFERGELVSILTTVPLRFGWGNAIGIAGVATRPEFRGQGYAEKLLAGVLTASERANEGAAYLFAKDPRVYERAGFRILDDVVQADIPWTPSNHPPALLSFDEVRDRYDRWATGSPDRLRRDDRRWQYWKWNLRLCHAVDAGYICQEGALVREALGLKERSKWPTTEAARWSGLRSTAQRGGIPLENETFATYFMGCRSPSVPELFLTDQF